MSRDAFRVKKGILHLTPVDTLPLNAELGDEVVLTTDGILYRFDGTQWVQVIDSESTQTLSNKTIIADEFTVDKFNGSIFTDSSTTGSLATLPAVDTFVVKLSNASLASLAGITAPTNARFFVLTNDLTTSVDVLNDDAGALAANRIITGTNRKIKLTAGASLWFFYDNATDNKWRVVGGSGAGGEGSVPKVRLHNATVTTLPTGSGLSIDGITVQAGDRVLFSNLTVNSDKIWEAQGTGTNITSWLALDLFNGLTAPTSGDLIVISEGQGFAGTLGVFRDSKWKFNDRVRFFNGVDYWEQSSLNTVALANNQVAPANVFSVAASGSENLVIDYSVLRGTSKDTGTMVISHNGTTVSYATYGANISDTGVSLLADLSSGNLRLRYTSTNTGVAPSIKYSVKRWSDAGGGPGNLPSYSITGTSVGGSGAAGEVAVWSTFSDVTSYPDFSFDTANGSLSIGSGTSEIERTKLTEVPLVDNTSGQLLFQLPHASYQFLVVDYSVIRGSDRSVGSLYITTNGTLTSVAPVFTDLGSPGVTFTADVSGSNVRLFANTSATGTGATLKYAIKRWI